MPCTKKYLDFSNFQLNKELGSSEIQISPLLLSTNAEPQSPFSKGRPIV